MVVVVSFFYHTRLWEREEKASGHTLHDRGSPAHETAAVRGCVQPTWRDTADAPARSPRGLGVRYDSTPLAGPPGHGSAGGDASPSMPTLSRVRVACMGRACATEGVTEGKAVATAKILVIDDEPSFVRALARLLQRDGYRVETAPNGRHVLAALQTQRYDVILCDLRMPELDGRAFYAHLRQRAPALCSRVIFLTGDSRAADHQAFLAQCGRPWLDKPCAIAVLRSAIAQVLERAVWAQQISDTFQALRQLSHALRSTVQTLRARVPRRATIRTPDPTIEEQRMPPALALLHPMPRSCLVLRAAATRQRAHHLQARSAVRPVEMR
jgi:CheY-like chemotaxis protein